MVKRIQIGASEDLISQKFVRESINVIILRKIKRRENIQNIRFKKRLELHFKRKYGFEVNV